MTNKIIEKTAEFVESKLKGEGSGHDWWHIYRVWKMAQYIGQKEKADRLVVELGALLHDIADWKFTGGDFKIGPKISREWLEKLKVDSKVIDRVCHIIEHISFKGAGEKNKIKSLEGKVVQDADRLDAIGAIGIARAFAFGGSKGNEIYNPNIKHKFHTSFKTYKNTNNTAINHFYEKLLLLKDRMNTKTGKKLAKTRHKFMEEYLKEFYKEWEGNL